MVVTGGFVEVGMNKVSVLADIAETSDEIDISAARTALDDATKALGAWSGGSEEEFQAVSERIAEAQAKIALGARK
jgi:F0F1-type ATP synthase epsilon subunit